MINRDVWRCHQSLFSQSRGFLNWLDFTGQDSSNNGKCDHTFNVGLFFMIFFFYQVKIVRFILKVSTLYSTSQMIWDVPKVYYLIPFFLVIVIVKFTLAWPTKYNFNHTKSMQWIKWADLAVMSSTTGAQVHDPCFWKALPMLELTLRVEGSTL